MNNNENLLEVTKLRKYFPIKGVKGPGVQAVQDVSFAIKKGETLGLVGESGCGKTTLGRTVLRLYEPTGGKIVYDGKVLFDNPLNPDGTPVGKAQSVNMLPYRRKMQIIFQDPSASLDPRMTVGEIIGEAIDIHKLAASKKDRDDRIKELLSRVGLNTEHANRYPHEFSGGQCQRIGIARALIIEPKMIICDEPVSALDVSIQAQVVNLLKSLQKEMGLSLIFIAHDLAVVKHISDRVLVMYLGNAMELGSDEEVYNNTKHPYTKALMSAVPIPDPKLERNKSIELLEGELPSPINPPSGCVFRTRCLKADENCAKQKPPLTSQNNSHFVACLKVL